MSHWLVIPILLPAFAATLMLIALNGNLVRQRAISIASVIALVGIAVMLQGRAAGGPSAYLVGNWPAPFGIVLVLDRLSALMLLLTSVIALASVIYAAAGWDTRGRHFHVLFQFQLVGINGAFLTGDVFNLFVFFEVMLIASYGLMLHGGGPWRLKAGFQYVAVNLVASTLFLFAVGLIYGVTGTLNLAHLSQRVTALAEGDHALLRTGAMLLFAVFAVKSALVPLHWWLPGTYAAAPAPAAAIFAVLTKVGAYCILRVHSVAFSGDAAGVSFALQSVLLPAAILTLAVGAIGVLASRTLSSLAAYAIIASMGTLLIAAGGLEQRQVAAVLYYILHSTLIGAALFLLVDVLAASRGRTTDRIVPTDAMTRPLVLGTLYLLAAIAMVGLPPLSGFVGKIAILDSFRAGNVAVVAWTAILLGSLLLLIGFARAGSTVFWKVSEAAPPPSEPVTVTALPIAVIAALIGATALLSVFGGPVMTVLEATARETVTPSAYVRAVLPTALSRGP